MDVGASTGGFTDCLLQYGASKVYAVDVGYGQLAWKLRDNPNVINIERQNIRHLDPEAIGEPMDMIVADASFISLALILPKVFELLKVGGDAVVLVKPQFEVEKGQVGKGGVIRDLELRLLALENVCNTARMSGFDVLGKIESPIQGAKKGNIEYLVHLKKT
jgi:23S rRNA (cytidine1920-2'-O)/16S rRNA (cytidine1409-2'-O)-methyltransferase